MNQYSLWDSPWIPVTKLSGETMKMSIRDTLANAEQLKDVFDPSPLVLVAIHRLLQAVLYRVYRPHTHSEWVKIWAKGRFDPTLLDDYGSDFSERLDLIHPVRPFYQVRELDDEKSHPVSALVLEAASGNNSTLFDHGKVEGNDFLPLDRAACYLLAHQQFAVGGGKSKPFNRMDGPLTKGMVVHAEGRNLFESILLNLIPLNRWENYVASFDDDCPFWEVDDHPEPEKEGTILNGPLHYLTWQSRQIHLHLNEDRSKVIGCQIRQRYALPKDGEKVDPAKPYRKSLKEGWQPYKLSKHRAAWHHSHVLLQRNPKSTKDIVAAPDLTGWLAYLQHNYRGKLNFPPVIDYLVAGLTTNPTKAAKIDLWRREQLSIPVAYFESAELVDEFEDQISRVSYFESHLFRTSLALAWACAERKHVHEAVAYIWTGKSPHLKAAQKNYQLISKSYGMTTRFWPSLEGPFRQLINDLPVLDWMDVSVSWGMSLQSAATHAYLEVRDSLLFQSSSYNVLSYIDQAFHSKLASIVKHQQGGEG